MENPQIENGRVVEMPNERFVLSRGGISFSAKSGRCASHHRERRPTCPVLPSRAFEPIHTHTLEAHRCSQLTLCNSPLVVRSHKFSGTGQLLLSPLRVVFQVRVPVKNAGPTPRTDRASSSSRHRPRLRASGTCHRCPCRRCTCFRRTA
jgi:hypothetical protein